jgi:type IV pilus assembly protein PilC
MAEPSPKPNAPLKKDFVLFERLSIQEKINFARHLAIVVKAGLPIYEGLKIIHRQSTSKTLTRILDQLLIDINNGRFLADSLERYKDIFGDFFINIIRVGEASGTLSQNLLYLAEELKKSKELQTKVRSAMVYPLVILFATLGLTTFLALFILPKLLPVLAGLKVKLPASTLFLLGTIHYLQTYGIATLVGIILFIVVARFLIKRFRPVRYAVHRTIFAIPVVNQLVIAVNMVTFARVLAMLLKSGVKIVEALAITSHTFSNLLYQDALLEAGEKIKAGGQLAATLESHSRLFPVLMSGMIEIGENTGNLEENLFYVSEYYDEEVDNRLKNMTSLLEPIMLLFMGLIVGFVAISIITPIYSLSQGVQ